MVVLRIYPAEHCWILKRNVLITFCLQGLEEVDLHSSESHFVPNSCFSHCCCCESSRKNPLHTVWQGSQKADGVLCNKHLGFLSACWERLTKTLVDLVPNHILLLITATGVHTIPILSEQKITPLCWREILLRGSARSNHFVLPRHQVSIWNERSSDYLTWVTQRLCQDF